MFGWLTSACASKPVRPRLRLARALELLPSMRTAAEVTAKLGEPDDRGCFNHDDPTNTSYLNRQSRDFWKQIAIAAPIGFIDILPIGTKMLEYDFSYAPLGLNPFVGVILVCIDNNDRVIGWMYSKELVGIEDKASLK